MYRAIAVVAGGKHPAQIFFVPTANKNVQDVAAQVAKEVQLERPSFAISVGDEALTIVTLVMEQTLYIALGAEEQEAVSALHVSKREIFIHLMQNPINFI